MKRSVAEKVFDVICLDSCCQLDYRASLCSQQQNSSFVIMPFSCSSVFPSNTNYDQQKIISLLGPLTLLTEIVRSRLQILLTSIVKKIFFFLVFMTRRQQFMKHCVTILTLALSQKKCVHQSVRVTPILLQRNRPDKCQTDFFQKTSVPISLKC